MNMKSSVLKVQTDRKYFGLVELQLITFSITGFNTGGEMFHNLFLVRFPLLFSSLFIGIILLFIREDIF